MKEIATFINQNNKSTIKQVTLYQLDNNSYQMWLVSDNANSSTKLNDELIGFLRISDCDEQNKNDRLSFITECQNNTVIISGNIHKAFQLMKTYQILDQQIINSLEDADELEVKNVFDQTNSIQINDFYQTSIEKRTDAGKQAPLSDENTTLLLQSENQFFQQLTTLTEQQQSIVLEKLAKDLKKLGYGLVSLPQEDIKPTIVGPIK